MGHSRPWALPILTKMLRQCSSILRTRLFDELTQIKQPDTFAVTQSSLLDTALAVLVTRQSL